MGKYAIVGLSCLFPGAATPDAYWNNLMGAVDSRTEGGERIFGHDPLAGSDSEDRHRIYCTRGGFLEAVPDLDPSRYLLPADYLAGLDRSFHWALRVAGDALADAGVSPAAADGRAAGRRTGVVFGNYPFPTPASGRTAGKLWDAAICEGLAAAGFPAAGLPSGAADGNPARDRDNGPARGPVAARAEAHDLGPFGGGAAGGRGGSSAQGLLDGRPEAHRLGSFEAGGEAGNLGPFGGGAAGGRGSSSAQGSVDGRPEAHRLGLFEARAEAHNLWPGGLPAHVVAAALGLGGPRHTLDAACSSALYAIKLACAQLATGRADLMLAGGVCAPDPTVIHLSFSDLHAYPPDGVSQPFDARSKGIITGQGAAMVALKRLADARRDGDRVYAVVDAVALGNDGPGKHLLVPNVNGQLAAYELAHRDAGIAPQDIQYVECHATGTPLGDRTELEGVERHFGRTPLLGSVKGNIGHLLTAAGMSSLVKVVLALGHGVIPPTVGVERPLPGTVADRVVREPTPWPATDGARRAAVSAFGFGGTNAHVVLSGPETDVEDDGTDRRAPQSLAVIGMGAHFGSFTTLDEFERAGYEGTGAVRELPSHRWRGFETLGEGGAPQAAYIDGFEVDATSYRIPPKDLDHFNQQHLLMMRVAEEALKDAGYERPAPGGKDGAKGRRVAVVLGMEMEPSAEGHGARYALDRKLAAWSAAAGLEPTEDQLAALTRAARDGIHDSIEANEVLSYIGNIMAARISSLWNLTGPSFTVSSDSAVGVDALDTARLLLLDPSIEAVLVGAVDLAAGPESTRARELLAPGSLLGDGAGAVVVTRPGSVPPERTVYATVDALAVHHSPTLDPRPAPDLVAAAAEEALAAAGLTPADVELVEAGAAQDGTLEGLTRVWSAERAGGGLRTAVSGVNSAVGDTGCASALASVIRAALCLHYGYQPIAPEGIDGARLAGSAFFLAGDSRPWLRERREGRRTAGVSVIGSAGSHAHVVLGGAQTRGEVAATDWVRSGGSLVVPVGADDIDTLMRRLGELRDAVDSGADWTARLAEDRPAALKAVLVADDTAGLVRQLDQAAKDLPAVYRAGGEWTSPSGSCFAARPAGGPGTRTALVYPGAFNSYLGLGRSLFRAFPGLLPRFETQAELPAEMLRSAALYPRALGPLGRRELMGREAELIEDIPLMLAVGTSYALLSTDLVREVLGVPVHGAFGYSLGESSMLFATGGWIKEARATTKIDASPLFVDRLRGPKKTVRALWGLGDEVPDQQVWATHVLLAPADAVRASVQRHDRVFITHVNTPTEVVVAGDPAQCRDVIDELGCQSARSPANHVMHCPVVDGVLSELADLNRYPTGDVGDLVLYSSRHYAPVGALDQDVVAHNIAVTLRETVDFPRLIRRAYEDGFRCFIEVGPSSTCTRWIHETLGDDPHLSVPVDRRGARGATDIARLVARLATHGVPVDLTPFRPRTAAPRRAPGLRTFTVGGTPVAPLVREAAAPVLGAVRRVPRRPVPPPTPAAAVMGGGAERAGHGAAPSPSRAPAAAATNAPGGEAAPRDGAPPQAPPPGGGDKRRPAPSLPVPAARPLRPKPAPIATTSGRAAAPQDRAAPAVPVPVGKAAVPVSASVAPAAAQPAAGPTAPVATASGRAAAPQDRAVPAAPVPVGKAAVPVSASVAPAAAQPAAGPTAPVATASGRAAAPQDRAVPAAPVPVGNTPVPVPVPAAGPPASTPAAAPLPAVTAVAPPRSAPPGAAAPVPVTAGAPDQAPELPVTALHATEWDTAMPTRPDGPPVPALSLEREPITMLPADAVTAPALGAVPPQAERADAPLRPAIFGAPLPVPDKPRQPDRPADDHSATLTLVRSLRAEILEAHQEVLDAQRELREELTAVLSASTPVPAAPAAATARPPKPEGVVWDEHDLLEFAVGKVGNVFGPRFTRIDGYERRVRLPAPPYLFATRVTRLDAEPGEFKPSFIRTEYDVPEDAWYAVDGQVPPAVTIEAGQCDLLLISYLGADFTNRGRRVYRLLDSSLSFLGDLPRTGQTLRYDIWIDQFVRQGDTLLFFFHYDCYADGELILKLNNACAGFFTDEELESSPGLVQGRVAPGLKQAADPGRTAFKPLATTHRTSLTSADLDALAEGRIADVFGPGHRQPPGCNTSLRLPTRPLLMADEVTVLDRKGGSHGLGRIEAVKELAPDAWYFTSHFPDDPVLAGSLVAEGAVQLLETYALSLGLHLTLPDARFQPVPDLRTEVKVRGQITPRNARIEYRIDITELTLLPRPSLVADVVVLRDGTPSISVTGLGIRLREKPGTPYRPETAGTVPHFLGRLSPATGEPALLNEFHMAHAAKGDLAVAMGPEFEIYADSRAPYIPNGDFLFVDRVMKLEGTRGTLKRGAVMVTEYDSPEDAWYYADNGHPYMPNCVYMESSLQAAILLGYYLGATLPFPEEQFSIRNLDGHATLVKDIDLRGKTVQHRSTLLSSDRMPGSILQNFSYELSCDGEVFYTGESLFGYFNEKALAHQVGLDKGQHVLPWLDTQPARPPGTRRVDLRDFRTAESARRGPRLAGGHLDLVEWVDILPGGGEHGQGYLRGHRSIRPDEWYFSCHFHRDPVMPGSLGVEALLQGMQVYAVETGLTDGLRNPRFALSAGTDTTWSYRGQILRTDPDMEFDVHIKEIRREPGRIVLLGDAHVWKSTLRIYRLGDLGIEIHHD
ncbi:beta-ketoacyl synthase N-terminal-like domain-containing protein [Streptomyces sp. NPDC001351]|uniref:beta-ketoacyl synthase N-terminal-like domain-containing protein n=1 Tax=Streptomyces sp. NPDC001351 TaxID=3364564 RepID=UPI0036C61AF0